MAVAESGINRPIAMPHACTCVSVIMSRCAHSLCRNRAQPLPLLLREGASMSCVPQEIDPKATALRLRAIEADQEIVLCTAWMEGSKSPPHRHNYGCIP